MAVKMGLVIKLAVLVVLLAAVSAAARSADLFDLLASNNHEAFGLVKHKSKAELGTVACCDKCVCADSDPPQCTCRDVYTDSSVCDGCDACICTRSIPPQCFCC